MRIRVADPSRDAARVTEIYRPYVERTVISFEEAVPSATEMADRIRSTLELTPWLVAEDESAGVVGYAYAGRHRARPGYRWSVDISVYLDPQWTGRGIGRALYDALLDILRRQRFVNCYAGVALPNPASVALHEAIGMQLVGTYRRVGYKLGEWPDVAWYWLQLAESSDPPPEPIPFPRLDAD